MSASSLLDTLYRAGHLRVIDHALAQSLRRLDPATPDAVLAAAALASLAVSKGHAGFLPASPQPLLDADVDWPSADAWTAQLEASAWVASPDDKSEPSDPQAPLVFEHGLLYLRRYREYERRLAVGLQRIGRHVPGQVDPSVRANTTARADTSAQANTTARANTSAQANIPGHANTSTQPNTHGSAETPGRTDLAALAPLFAQLFPDAASGEDRQAIAAATALRHSLLLVTGGPGTGKTTTITRLLVLLVAQALHSGNPAPRIALAAPTGRAAERMAESLRTALQSLTALGFDAALCAQLPLAGTTLHRLLGTIPDSPRFRHHADNPLPFDVVVVDEASMIDLPLMAKLVEAVADGARLVLLGDPDQLPSVEAGDVLSGILQATGDGNHLIDADALSPLYPVGAPHGRDALASVPVSTPSGRDASATFPGRHVHLNRGYRQSASLELAPLANAVRDGDAPTALSLLRGNTLAGVHFHEDLADPLQTQRERLLVHWRAIADAASPARALALAHRLRLLTAVREGPQGARSLNARIEAMLSENGLGGARRGAGSGASQYFHGRLLLITENSYRHRLFNGDIGICLEGDDANLMAWFPGGDPHNPRPFHPASLPAHESAFAMTVHKAQGSEFEEVWLLLPARFNRVLSRELVYTGITRARSKLHLAGSEAVLREALSRHASRWSGLGWRLGAGAEAGEDGAPHAQQESGDSIHRSLF